MDDRRIQLAIQLWHKYYYLPPKNLAKLLGVPEKTFRSYISPIVKRLEYEERNAFSLPSGHCHRCHIKNEKPYSPYCNQCQPLLESELFPYELLNTLGGWHHYDLLTNHESVV